jgi:general stress protein 26
LGLGSKINPTNQNLKSCEGNIMHEGVFLAHKVWGGRHLTREEIEFFLKEVRTARFCSHNNDETIHAAPVWFKYENGKIVILTPQHSCKARNVKRNKNVSILIDVEKPPRGVLIYGKAELDNEFDLKPTAIWLCEKYMSKEKAKDQWRSACPPATNWLKITVKPERMASFDYG